MLISIFQSGTGDIAQHFTQRVRAGHEVRYRDIVRTGLED
jgi:hypothetical protein